MTLQDLRQVDVPQPPRVVEEIKAAISPWLWIFSIVGFGMALLNTYRVTRLWRSR
jgi:hypothetical protein